MADELFAATIDGPATLNGVAVDPRPPAPLAESLVVTGFAYDPAVRARQAEIVARLVPQARDIRRMGSAALDLAWLAAGRYDAYYERTVKWWDIAAGTLLCRRAGLAVRDLPEREGMPYGVAAGNAALLDVLLDFGL
jgi:myo-inositol-1(or 4)-monophosphatase